MSATPKAMQAARKYTGCDGCTWPGCEEETVSIAALLDAFADAARADERRLFAPFVIREALSEYEIHARGVPERLIELITEAAIAKRGAK